MPRLRAVLLASFATLLWGCGGAGGLLATVPPPVEFAGARVSGLNELPPTGTYTGKLTVDRVEYRYDGQWQLVEAVPVSESTDAEATVRSDGTVVLRRGSEAFSGTATVSTDPMDLVPTVTLTAPDGSRAVYPYALRKADDTTLTVVVHGKVQGAGTARQRFTRYTFDVTLVTQN